MNDGSEGNQDPVAWYLESLAEGPRNMRVPLRPPVFRIGRHPQLDLTLNADAVSKRHAAIYFEKDGLRLKDLGSTNGSYVNEERVPDALLREGDILSFGGMEFRLGRSSGGESPRPATVPIDDAERAAATAGQFQVLLEQGAVSMLFQPIFDIETEKVVGHEALGRGLLPGLPQDPLELFSLAGSYGRQADLSRLFRRKTVETLVGHGELSAVFMNTHASEEDLDTLVESLIDVRRRLPEASLVLEVHEGAIAELSAMEELRTRLRALEIGLAFDDFGSGQARLLELAEVPPDWLKFDVRLIRGIDTAPASRVRLLRSLVSTAHEAEVRTVAEGVETAAEASACREIGFTHAQGFYFRKPALLEKGEV